MVTAHALHQVGDHQSAGTSRFFHMDFEHARTFSTKQSKHTDWVDCPLLIVTRDWPMWAAEIGYIGGVSPKNGPYLVPPVFEPHGQHDGGPDCTS